jgi:hypothetical protein
MPCDKVALLQALEQELAALQTDSALCEEYRQKEFLRNL